MNARYTARAGTALQAEPATTALSASTRATPSEPPSVLRVPGTTTRVRWCRFPQAARLPTAQAWLADLIHQGCSDKTLDGYARGLERYLNFCSQHSVQPEHASKKHLIAYAQQLGHRKSGASPSSAQGLQLRNPDSPPLPAGSFATQRLDFTALRRYYAYLVHAHVRRDNPLTGGVTLRSWLSESCGERHGSAEASRCSRERHGNQAPWCPSDEQWQAMLKVLQEETLRNRVMFALVCEAGLRCAELCRLTIADLDLDHLLITLPRRSGGTLHSRPISYLTAELCRGYIATLPCLGQPGAEKPGPLFRSESWRNRMRPVSPTTWSKVIRRLSQRSGVENLTMPALHRLSGERQLALWRAAAFKYPPEMDTASQYALSCPTSPAGTLTAFGRPGFRA